MVTVACAVYHTDEHGNQIPCPDEDRRPGAACLREAAVAAIAEGIREGCLTCPPEQLAETVLDDLLAFLAESGYRRWVHLPSLRGA